LYEFIETAEIDFKDLVEDYRLPEIDTDSFIDEFYKELEDEDKEEQEDTVPEAPKIPVIQPGDLIELGEHRLVCGDSTDKQTVEYLMGGDKADMVFTDPPYGMDLQADYSKMHKKVQKGSTAKAKAGTVGSRWDNIRGDDEEFYPEFLLEHFNYVKEIFIWGGEYFYQNLPKGGVFIVWDKNNGNEGADKMIGSGYELCWSKQRHQRVMCRMFGRGTFGHDKVKVHPTQKPAQLAEWFFEKWGKDAQNIVDIYGGSGSTLIACEKTKRKCYMMELDPIYCDVIVKRYCDYVKNDKIKINGKSVSWSDLSKDEE